MEFLFPTVHWPAFGADATFFAGEELPPESRGRLYAVLVFLFYGDKITLADIPNRGFCIPSGRIESGETLDECAERECFEETGAHVSPDSRRMVGWFRLSPRARAGEIRYCPVFVAEALGFQDIPAGSESKGMFLASVEDVGDVYYMWDQLTAAVFDYTDERRKELFPAGVGIARFMDAQDPA